MQAVLAEHPSLSTVQVGNTGLDPETYYVEYEVGVTGRLMQVAFIPVNKSWGALGMPIRFGNYQSYALDGDLIDRNNVPDVIILYPFSDR